MISIPSIGPTFGWSFGWSIAAAVFMGSGGSSGWKDGGALVGITLAALAWAVAGLISPLSLQRNVFSIRKSEVVSVLLGWVFAFFVSLIFGYFLGVLCEQSGAAGFIGYTISVGIGGALGAGVTGYILYKTSLRTHWGVYAILMHSLISAVGFCSGVLHLSAQRLHPG